VSAFAIDVAPDPAAAKPPPPAGAKPPRPDAAAVREGLKRLAAERSAERKVLLRLLPTLFIFSLLNYIDRCGPGF
jgi:hypothetical protein